MSDTPTHMPEHSNVFICERCDIGAVATELYWNPNARQWHCEDCCEDYGIEQNKALTYRQFVVKAGADI